MDALAGTWGFTICVVAIVVSLPFILPYITDLSFGIFKVKTLNTVDRMWQNDIMTKTLCERQIMQIDYETRRRMRDAARRAVNWAVKQYPGAKDMILRGRVAISTSICDNHITYDFKRDLKKFIFNKAEACAQEQFRELTTSEYEVMTEYTAQWVREIMPIQRWAIEQKIDAYVSAIEHYNLDVFKKTATELIKKNNEYLECIEEIIPDDTVTWRKTTVADIMGSSPSCISSTDNAAADTATSESKKSAKEAVSTLSKATTEQNRPDTQDQG